jgi:ferritin
MLSQKMQKAVNAQIAAETYSATLYQSMAAYFESINLPGFARWMEVQAGEETGHAMKFYKHVIERRGRVLLGAVAAPPTEWKSPLAAFEAAFQHEQKVTGMIHGLMGLAVREEDYPSQIMLQWFVSEQVEEEANADRIVQTLKTIGEAAVPMIMLDHELGARKAS